MKKIRLLHGKILIQRNAVDDKTSGGIFLPDVAKDKNVGEGTVVQGDEDEIITGTTVLFNKYAGTDVNLDDGNEYVAVDVRDILAIREFKRNPTPTR